jgi:stage II sporulation protein D
MNLRHRVQVVDYGLSMLLLTLAVAAGGCGRSEAPIDVHEPRPVTREPVIRIQLLHNVNMAAIAGPRRVEVQVLGVPETRRSFAAPLQIERVSGRWLGRNGAEVSFPDNAHLEIRKIGPEALSINHRTYPGSLVLVPTEPLSASRFDVINHSKLEHYLPGVLDSELPDKWSPAAYLAQAIAARSYAMIQIQKYGPGRHYDLKASPSSQAYGGLTPHPIANMAVRDTAGLVLTWNNKILPSYYSSTCGGVGQSAADAFGSSHQADPLIPRYDHPHWCKASRHYRWGPIKRDLTSYSNRLRAWGKYKNLAIQKLGQIRAIKPSRRNPGGRVTHFTIHDDKGVHYTLASDSVRSASNFYRTVDNLTAPAPNQRLKSGYVDVAIRGGVVVFGEGRGYGHGVGLCQYGAQAMAVAGKDPIEILNEYYPKAKVERAY